MTTKTVYNSAVIDPATGQPLAMLATLNNDGVTWRVSGVGGSGYTPSLDFSDARNSMYEGDG